MSLQNIIRVTFVWVLLCFVLPVQASDLEDIQVYRDSTTRKTFAQIQKLPESAWQTPHKNMYFGITDDVIWLRFKTPKNLQNSQTWLRSVRSNLDHLCVYSQQNQSWSKNCQGTREPLDESAFIAADLLFSIANTQSLHYASAQSKSILILPLEALENAQMMKEVQGKQISEWMALGLILATCLYNLLVFGLLRDQIFLIHALSSVFFTLYWFGFVMGHARILSQNIYSSISLMAYALACISAIFGIEAIRRVAIKPEDRYWQGVCYFFQAWSLLGAIMMIPQWRTLVLIQINITNLLVPFVFVILLIDLLRHRQWSSAAYISTWLSYSLSMLLIALGFQGFIPFSIRNMHLFSWAYAAPMLLLSWMLAIRVRNLQKEQKSLLLTQMQLIQSHSLELEEKVKQRTQQLETALSELSATNRFKDKLFSIMAHDLRSPFSSLQTMLNLLDRRNISIDMVQQMVPRMRNHLEGVYTSLENMLIWARNQMREYHDQPQIIDPRKIIKETLDLYAASAEQKNIVIISHLEESNHIYVDPDQLRVILRNLVNNAIKFTPKGGEIRLQITQKDHEMMLSVEDTGRGITKIQLNLIQQGELNITHFGTEGEKGMGLGLELCRNYLYQNGGRWEIDSEIDHGTRFCLYFPASSKSLVRSS